MKPMLARPYTEKTFQPCWVQPKLNGVRALYQNGVMYSRDEKRFNDRVIEVQLNQLSNLPPDFIFDGELYVHGWPLQRINGAIGVNRLSPRDDSFFVEFHIFDVIANEPFGKRHEFIKSLIGSADYRNIKLVPTHWCDSVEQSNWQYELYLTAGYEGLIYRDANAPYTHPHENADQNNRTKYLRKRKGWQDDEFEIIRVVEGEGKRSGMLGAFTCKTKSGTEFNVGTGLGWTIEELTKYLSNPPIGKLLTVQYITLSTDGIPQNPSARAIRDYE